MDLVLKNGLVFDGTGAPGRPADVGVQAGRIVAVTEPGELSAEGAEVVDLDGLALAPGFVDIHTHYDAQVTWDPDFTPSSWHGVTTVVMGNCGFGIAPTRPEHRGVIARTLENVEGMTIEALEAGIDWSFETFPEYLDAVDRMPKRLNVGAMIGHTPVRLYVLGDEASDRAATPDEIERMAELVREGIRAGAVGFATSHSPIHVGDRGRPVPSRLAELAEIRALVHVLGEEGRGVVQAATGPTLSVDEFAELASASGRPVTWTALLTGMQAKGVAVAQIDKQAALAGEVWPQVACRPIVGQINLVDPGSFSVLPSFTTVLAAPRSERAAVYADPAWREQARGEVNPVLNWSKVTVQETTMHTDVRNGPSLAELAAARGVEAFDLLIDLSLAEDLQTRFRIIFANDDEEEVGELLRDDRTVLGLSDAGAHQSQLCDACFSTHLLGYWSRKQQVLPLETAIWRLTGQPAHVFRLADRGVLRPGAWADLVAFDPATVDAMEIERVWDLPTGADRLIARSIGIEHIWVNGVAIRRAGVDLDARPGVLLRG